MNELTQNLISNAPKILVFVAIAIFINGIFNAVSSIQLMLTQGSEFRYSFLFSFLGASLYQPALLIAWAASIHYLSQIARVRK